MIGFYKSSPNIKLHTYCALVQFVILCLDCVKVMQKKQDLVKPSLTQGEQESVVNIEPADSTVTAKKGTSM